MIKFASIVKTADFLYINSSMEVFFGVPAADGIGIGTAFVIPDSVKRTVVQRRIKDSQLEEGWARFEKAIQTVTEEISQNLAALDPADDKNKIQREVFETYILMLGDPVFLDEVRKFYEHEKFNIEYTIQFKAEEYANRLRNAGNEYLAERAKDITDVFGSVLDEMLEITHFDIKNVPDGSVIVATTLSSSDTIILSKRKIAGLALTEGGVSSHVVILARNYGIPTIVGLDDITKKITNGSTLIIDGAQAELLADADEATLEDYRTKITRENERKQALKAYLDKPAVTTDGTEFKLYANIGTPEEAELAKEEGADGIGLFRTEFLYMAESGNSVHAAARSFSEDSQFEAYKKVLQIMEGKPVTIRTLDAGGDKLINSVDIPALDEKNPLMGMRAVRLSLAYPALFKTQIRALYRASVYGNLKIMLPLITSVEQVEKCLELIEEAKNELREKQIPFNDNVPVGIMIETAAAAIISDCFAGKADFFSLGTNDLTQYTLGVDRENHAVAPLYDEFNLAVLRLIQTTVSNAKRSNIPVSVCGEMAGHKDSLMVLCGMGIRSLSMSAKLIPQTKELLAQFSIEELQAISLKRLNKF